MQDQEQDHWQEDWKKLESECDSDIPDNHYCLGSYIQSKLFLVGTRIPIGLFYSNTIDYLENLIQDYSITVKEVPKIEIIQVKYMLMNSCNWISYGAILKTHWLRIIQRKWKRVFRMRISYMQTPAHVRMREITGKWNPPGINGLLCEYK